MFDTSFEGDFVLQRINNYCIEARLEPYEEDPRWDMFDKDSWEERMAAMCYDLDFNEGDLDG